MTVPNPFADLAAKLGIDPDAPVEPEGEPFITHVEFSRRVPRWESEACQGMLRIFDRSERLLCLACDECRFEVAVPAMTVSAVERRRRLEQAGIPGSFLGVKFEEDEHNRDALYLCRGWLADYGKGDRLPALALVGQLGTGKSHLLAGLCSRLVLEHGASVLFRPVRGLLRELQRFENEAERSAAWERARTVDVLALDDLGAQQVTDWRHDQLAELVDERYQAEKPILVATNFRPASWEQVLDARTASRLRGMTVPVELRGPDRRQQSISIEGAAA